MIVICVVTITYTFADNNNRTLDTIDFYDIEQSEVSKFHPTPGVITVVASTPVSDGVTPEQYMFDDIKKCGFNVIICNADKESMDTIFQYAENAGLKVMPASIKLRDDRCVEFVESLKNNPAIVGWDFVDEPQIKDLKKLGKYYKMLRSAAPDKLVYINLIGAEIKKFTGESPSLAAYLDTIQRYFAPDVWSYDLYPISVKNGKVTVAGERFYMDLEIFSRKSKETKRPFWAYCQSMAFKNSVIERPAANLSYLRFEAFSALAYGAQGIVYWTYGQRKSTDIEKYFSALVNCPYKKTSAWEAARQVNSEIAKYNDVFYNSILMECYHTGIHNYKYTKKLNGKIGPFTKINSGREGVLVSHLKTNGKYYVVIVNHDIFKSQRIELLTEDEMRVKSLTLGLTDMRQQGNYIVDIIPPGGYAIYAYGS